MKNRNPVVVVLLSLLTFGIYGLVWAVLTARELRAQGADIPNSILIIIPILSLIWLWKYSEGIAKVSSNKYSSAIVFILFFFTGIGGMIISQLALNEAAAGPVAASPSPAPEANNQSSPVATPSVSPTPGVTTAATAGVVTPAATTETFTPNPAPEAVAVTPTVEPTPVTPPTVTPTEVAVAPSVEPAVVTPETPEPTVAYAPLPSTNPEPVVQEAPVDPSTAPVVPAPAPEENQQV